MLRYLFADDFVLRVYRFVYKVYYSILHIVVSTDDSCTVVQHYVETFIDNLITYYHCPIVAIPFAQCTFAHIGSAVVPLNQVHAGNDICHRVAQFINQRRRYTCVYWSLCIFCCMVDAILLGYEFFYSIVVGQEEGVLPPCGEQPEQFGSFHQSYHMRILVATVKQKVRHCLTSEGVTIALVNLVGAGED